MMAFVSQDNRFAENESVTLQELRQEQFVAYILLCVFLPVTKYINISYKEDIHKKRYPISSSDKISCESLERAARNAK